VFVEFCRADELAQTQAEPSLEEKVSGETPTAPTANPPEEHDRGENGIEEEIVEQTKRPTKKLSRDEREALPPGRTDDYGPNVQRLGRAKPDQTWGKMTPQAEEGRRIFRTRLQPEVTDT